MSTAASLLCAHPVLLLGHSQGAKPPMGWAVRLVWGALGTQVGRRLIAELCTVPRAPHVASSRHGAMYLTCWEHRLQVVGHTSKSLSHSPGQVSSRCTSFFLQLSTPQLSWRLQLEHLMFLPAPILWPEFSARTPPLLSLPPSLCKHLRWIINCNSSN